MEERIDAPTVAHGPEDSAIVRSALEARLREAFEPHLDAVWLFVRRLGIPEGDVDDVVQDAVVVLAKRLPEITPGSEKSFLFSTAYRMSSDARIKRRRKNEVGADVLGDMRDASPDAGDLLDQRRALAELDDVLEAMPMDLRAVFVLHELEERTMADIAQLMDIAPGTIASRLRRARELFTSSFAHYRRDKEGQA